MDQSLRTRMVRDRAIYQGVRGVVGTRYSDTTSTYVLGRVGGTSVCCNGTSVPTPPNAPLIADTDVSDGSVIIYIADRAITAYAYSVNDPSGAITDVSYSSPIIITGLTNGTAYTFYVRAKNEAGYSEPTSTGPLTPVGPPSAPVISSPISGNNQLSVPFTTPANGGSPITGYKYALNGGSYSPLGLVTSPAIITGLTNGTTYTVNLKATNAIGDSAASNTESGTPAGPPSAPTINGVSSTGTNAIITFTAGSDQGSPITNYQYSTNGGSTYNFFSPAQTTSPLTVTGLAYNTTYSIRIKAVNSIGPGAASIAFSLTTPSAPATVPPAPTTLSATSGDSSAIISFTQSGTGGSPITNYAYSTDGVTYTDLPTPDTTSPITITGLTNGVPYNISLKAKNAIGYSPASSSVSVTPAIPITGDTNVILLGDSSVTSVATYLNNAKTALGYGGTMNITTQQLNGYTGDTLSSYDVAIIYTNGGLNLNGTLGTNLNNFVTSGKHLIMMTFAWGNVSAITNFDYTNNSTYAYSGTQGSATTSTAVYDVSHPITTGLSTSTGVASANISGPSLTLTSGATKIASFSGNQAFIAVKQQGAAKLVGINLYPFNTSGSLHKYTVNAIYWSMGYLV